MNHFGFSGALAVAATFMASNEMAADSFKEEALEKLKKARELPRKKKKLMKKHALIDYSLAVWTEDNMCFKF